MNEGQASVRAILGAALAALAAAGCGSSTHASPATDAGSDHVAMPPHDGGGTQTDGRADGSSTSGCPTGAAGQSTELRCTGLYADWATKALAPGVRQYDPGLHLWSDGADKVRWIYLPPGTQIDTSNMDQWSFPNGTKIWKQFTVNQVLTETRLLWKRPTGKWYVTTYRWSADLSRADELTAGEVGSAPGSYEIPTQNACYDCHNGRWDLVLGFEAVSLSSPAASGVTMATLTAENLLTAPPAAPLTIPGDAKTAAALGYLHTNCGVPCHNRDGGMGGDVGLYLRLDAATLGSVQATDAWTTGMNVNSSYGIPGVAQPKVFAPCAPGSSTAYYRMSVRDGINGTAYKTQMPPTITHQVDQTGLAALAAWLNDQPQCAARSRPVIR